MPESDPTTAPAPTDLDDPATLAVPPGISRRQALAMGGGLAAAAAVIGAGPASAQETASPSPSAPPPVTPSAAPTTPPPPPTDDPGLAGEPQTVQSISLAQAQVVLERAEARAKEIQRNMNIVIIDVCGDVKASIRQDGNGRASLVLAPLKAQTALAFRTATADLAGQQTDRVQAFVAAGFTVLGGGLPIRSTTGAVIGAIGVGGGSPDEDVDVARAGLGLPPATAAPTPPASPSGVPVPSEPPS